MNIFSTFEYGIEIEQALAELEDHGIGQEQILVVFMDNEPFPAHVTARTKQIYSNAFEVGMACATGCAVIGASSGFVLHWGPIVWGLIGTILGFSIGFFLYCIAKRNAVRTPTGAKRPAILVIIQCTANQTNPIKNILWRYNALMVGQADRSG